MVIKIIDYIKYFIQNKGEMYEAEKKIIEKFSCEDFQENSLGRSPLPRVYLGFDGSQMYSFKFNQEQNDSKSIRITKAGNTNQLESLCDLEKFLIKNKWAKEESK